MKSSFWEQSAKDVARSLTGYWLKVGDRQAVILNATAYSRSEQKSGLYKPMLSMSAGEVYCPRLMNAILLCIVTGQGKSLGGCIRIDDIELDGVRYTGPGKVTSALGITVPKSTGTTQVVDKWLVEISLPTLAGSNPGKKPKSASPKPPRIGKRTIKKLLPKIAQKYLSENPPVTFEQYLNGLLAECSTYPELVKRLNS